MVKTTILSSNLPIPIMISRTHPRHLKMTEMTIILTPLEVSLTACIYNTTNKYIPLFYQKQDSKSSKSRAMFVNL